MNATSLGFCTLPTLSSPIAQSNRGYRLHFHQHTTHPSFSRNFRILASEQDDSNYVSSSERTSTSPISNIPVEELEQKLGKRRRSRKDKPAKVATEPKRPQKDWEAMTFSEKAWEIYVGEKGVLFWLNKLAYAAIFVIIGGWIAFRFVGPALNLYQLDSPLLPPDQVLGGSK